MPGPALTDLGSEQAQALVPALAEEPLDAIYSSIALRAQQTAQPLADERALELQVREGVREITAGELEMAGDLPSIKKYLKVVFGWLVGQPELRMPGGETGIEVLGRFDEVVQEVLDAGHRSAAIVSHGAMIRIWAASRAVNADLQNPQKYDLSNTGVVVLDYEDNGTDRPWRLVSWTAEPAGGAAVADSRHDGPDLEGLSAEKD